MRCIDAIKLTSDMMDAIHNGYHEEDMLDIVNEQEEVNPFQVVFKALCQIDMFRGIYDARNGDDHFMYGIQTVMDFISYQLPEKEGEAFEKEFLDNMQKSRAKAEKENKDDRKTSVKNSTVNHR